MHCYKRGDVWWFEFEYGGTRYRESTGSREKLEARRIANKRRAQVQAGEPSWRNRLREARLVDLFAREAVEAETKQLAKGYRNAIDSSHRRLVEFFGSNATLAAITYDTVREYERWRRESGKRGQTITEEVACLKRAFKRAKRMKLIRLDLEEWPVIRSDTKDEGRSGKMVPAAAFSALLAELDDDVRGELHFTYLTGLRREELPEIRATWLRKDRGGSTLQVPASARKSGPAYEIPLPEEARRILMERIETAFAKGSKVPFPPHDWRKRIASAAKRAKVPPCHYRDLRTTYGRLIEKQGGAFAARDSMGHVSVNTTNVYMGATLDDRRAAANEAAAALRHAKKQGGRRK